MTNKNKRSRLQAQGNGHQPVRHPSTPESASRKGLLDAIFAPRVSGSTSMPSIRTSLARGVAVVAGTPTLAIASVVIVVSEWLGALALGFEGPFAIFVSALAMPPVGTSFDASLSTALFGLQGGFFAILGFVAWRAIVQALLVATIVETLRSTPLGRWTLFRAIRVLPVTLAVNMAGVGLLTVASIAGPALGPAFGLLIQMGALVGGVYLLSFAPAIAADGPRRLSETMGRSVRAARMPGAGNLTFAAIYVVASIALLVAPGKPGSELGVNPTVGAWVLVLVVGLVHVAVQAALVFRYLSVADEVPEAAPRRRAEPRARGRR
ncbi:MAG: hypothetical protein OEW46_02500 [Actinomycetota bacterium]|nr:hypothetical protein [Actinomycetota bacterium]